MFLTRIKYRGIIPQIFVWKTDNEYWKKYVSIVLENSELVFFDMDRVSENMKWELEQALVKKEFSKIIFACTESEKPKNNQKIIEAINATGVKLEEKLIINQIYTYKEDENFHFF